MEALSTQVGIVVRYDAAELETARSVAAAVDLSVPLIRELWGFAGPDDIEVHIMTSWPGFLWRAYEPVYRPILLLSLPFWLSRVYRLWTQAAGWNLGGRRRARVGIKPARLLPEGQTEIGRLIYAPGQQPTERMENVVCHELTHSFSSHLSLPVWLNEGIAFLSSDALAGELTIRRDSIDLLRGDRGGAAALSDYRRVNVSRARALAYQMARGYWLTRLLSAEHPQVLRDLLSEPLGHAAIEQRVAKAMGLPVERTWEDVDGVLVSYFQG